MPELPDIALYINCLRPRTVGQSLRSVRLNSPFLLRSVAPPLDAFSGRVVRDYERLGKRIVLVFDEEHFLVIHLVIAGRLHWQEAGVALGGKYSLAAFDFPTGSLTLTEAGAKRRASLHAVHGRDGLIRHDPGGLEVLNADRARFAERLTWENHTVKRSLTDPRIVSGISNAYSDDILHRARLSPLRWTDSLTDLEIGRLWEACRAVLGEWTERLTREAGQGFPEKVTAFRPAMAAHGKFGQPCPVCGSPIQRIAYADNETNYCPTCQTDGKLLADRGLSRLLKADWPRTLAELDELKAGAQAAIASPPRLRRS
ncbi:MAG: formamidopyrimidine-DNA glycosylase [Alphaproteobacteria bacterium]|nr:formamidopyrimidine-DNA glycosylase [Alphaproteobacteria bacterium]